jgi:hypothetical protein
MLASPILGAPGVSNRIQTGYRRAFWQPIPDTFLAGGKTIDGSVSRDPGNGVITNLRAGLWLGKVTATGFYAPSDYGLTDAALTGAGTTVTLASAAIGTEIVRRKGATGTVKLTGPPTAAGTVRTLTATYSAISNVSMTITALGVSQVDTFRFGTAATGGNLQLTIQKPDGTFVTTGSAAWSATDATYISALNTALDAAGSAGAIVASAISAVDTDFGFVLTYTNANYPTGATAAQVALLPTGATAPVYTRNTAAVDGRFVTQSLIQPVDGSETRMTFVNEGFGIQVTSSIDGSAIYAQDYKFPIGGNPELAQLLPYPADTALRAYMIAQSQANGQTFVYKDPF